MHDDDFELVTTGNGPGATRLYTVRIKALGIERVYLHDPANDYIHITGPETKILVNGHDMTSIIGKRVREWLRSRI